MIESTAAKEQRQLIFLGILLSYIYFLLASVMFIFVIGGDAGLLSSLGQEQTPAKSPKKKRVKRQTKQNSVTFYDRNVCMYL